MIRIASEAISARRVRNKRRERANGRYHDFKLPLLGTVNVRSGSSPVVGERQFYGRETWRTTVSGRPTPAVGVAVDIPRERPFATAR
jgi:hypothetical protein